MNQRERTYNDLKDYFIYCENNNLNPKYEESMILYSEYRTPVDFELIRIQKQ